MSEQSLLVMAMLVVVALVFDFMNGFHDAANSIALMVSTRLLTPQAAVAWAAFVNFIAFLIFGVAVAKTIGSGIVDPAIVDNAVIFGALCGAIIWNLVTWWFGIPSSSRSPCHWPCSGCWKRPLPPAPRRSSTRCSSSPHRSTASATAATTRRKPWASSPDCCMPTATWRARSTCRCGSCSPAMPRWAWVLAIPVSGLIAAIFWNLGHGFMGQP